MAGTSQTQIVIYPLSVLNTMTVGDGRLIAVASKKDPGYDASLRPCLGCQNSRRGRPCAHKDDCLYYRNPDE